MKIIVRYVQTVKSDYNGKLYEEFATNAGDKVQVESAFNRVLLTPDKNYLVELNAYPYNKDGTPKAGIGARVLCEVN